MALRPCSARDLLYFPSGEMISKIVSPKWTAQSGSVEVVAEKYLAIQKQWGTPWGANMSELASQTH